VGSNDSFNRTNGTEDGTPKKHISKNYSSSVTPQPKQVDALKISPELKKEQFDASKWCEVILANIKMIGDKVDASTPHKILSREVDDLKVIVKNSFDQLQKSYSRQLDAIKGQTNAINLYQA
jgi:hypothetical protein